MATPNPIYPGIRLRERYASARGPDVDRPLDQFDSHLSPLRTGMGSRSFRLRAVRIGDGETAGLRESYDASKLWRLHSPRFRRVLAQVTEVMENAQAPSSQIV